MLRKLLFATLILAGMSASATPPLLVRYETPIEANVSDVTLPTQVPDTLIFNSKLTLSVTAKTRFFVNRQQVDLAELRRQAIGNRFVGIYYLEETNVVTRIAITTE